MIIDNWQDRFKSEIMKTIEMGLMTISVIGMWLQ